MQNSIFIKGNVPSLKNSKQFSARKDKRGKIITSLTHSKTVQKYLRSLGIKHYSSSKKTVTGYKRIPTSFPENELKTLFKGRDYPLIVGFHFIRGSRHKWDFHNACQILFDLFVAYDIVEDDNSDCVLAVPMLDNKLNTYSYDKDNPGVWIKLYNINELNFKLDGDTK